MLSPLSRLKFLNVNHILFPLHQMTCKWYNIVMQCHEPYSAFILIFFFWTRLMLKQGGCIQVRHNLVSNMAISPFEAFEVCICFSRNRIRVCFSLHCKSIYLTRFTLITTNFRLIRHKLPHVPMLQALLTRPAAKSTWARRKKKTKKDFPWLEMFRSKKRHVSFL